MLLRFNVSNCLSFNEMTEFNSFTGDHRRFDNHVFKYKNVDLLKISAIYGANATGKSNLIEALDYMRDAVISEDLKKIELFEFKGNEDKSSSFELEFLIEDTVYIYGFEIFSYKVKNEYLYFSGLGKKDELIFDRTVNDKGVSNISIGKKYLKLKKHKTLKEHYEEKSTPNQLFVNVVGDVNLGDLSIHIDNVFTWFVRLQIIFPYSKPMHLVSNLINKPSFMDFTKDVLCSFDTGIKSLHIKEFGVKDYFGEDDKGYVNDLVEDLENSDRSNLPLDVDMIITMEEGVPVIKKLYVEHVGFGSKKLFSYHEESDGTKRLIEFMSLLYNLLVNKNSNNVYIIDEIGRSLHPYLLKKFLSKLSKEENLYGQLVFTTHESHLLDLSILRPDEIWFAEKNSKNGTTEFKTLSEFNRIRPDLNIRKGYLEGRFGGIPFLANLEDLNWSDYAAN